MTSSRQYPTGEYYMIVERDSSHQGGRFVLCDPKAVEEDKVRVNACTKPEGRMLYDTTDETLERLKDKEFSYGNVVLLCCRRYNLRHLS